MTSAEFWSITLPEVFVHLEASWFIQREAMDLMKAQAWWTAALSGQERLQPLAEFLDLKPKQKVRRDKPQSLEALKSEWRGFFNRARQA
jgi:iron uptake system EfeUOB component EfeO/EfeM